MRYVTAGRFATIALLLHLTFATSAFALLANNASSKRCVYYYQTEFSTTNNNTELISLLPLISNENRSSQGNPFTTDVLVGAFHLGPEKDNTTMHLNDRPPNDSIYAPLWNQTAELQSNGINVNLFLGGYEDQSFVNLASNFSYYYPILKQNIETYNFNGIDLDVEDSVETTADMVTLINQLRSDFGKEFIITLAPVATDLMPDGGGLSLIDYAELFEEVGSKISWFNVQFYSGFGTLGTTSDYISIIDNNFPADVVVGGMMANPANGNGFVDMAIVKQTVESLVQLYPNFGGVDAWEYFNADPGGQSDPSEWSIYFGQAMGV